MRINQYGTEFMLFLKRKFDSMYDNERKQINEMNKIKFLDAF